MINKWLLGTSIVTAAVAIIITLGHLSLEQARMQTVVVPMAIPAIEKERGNVWGLEVREEAEHCLALNIYFEARGEHISGQYAVADVVMYRLLNQNYPNTVCEVIRDGYYYDWNPDLPVKHKCQFSWWCDGQSDDPVNGKAFNQALKVAKEVLHDPDYMPRVEYSIYYHANNVRPHWVDAVEFVDGIGNHSFYR